MNRFPSSNFYCNKWFTQVKAKILEVKHKKHKAFLYKTFCRQATLSQQYTKITTAQLQDFVRAHDKRTECP